MRRPPLTTTPRRQPIFAVFHLLSLSSITPVQFSSRDLIYAGSIGVNRRNADSCEITLDADCRRCVRAASTRA